jgi:hypothetical protein
MSRFGLGFIGAKEPPLTTLTKITNTGATSTTASTISYPASIQAGDLLVLYQAAIADNGNTALPSGWVEYQNVILGGTSWRVRVAYKIATGEETGTFTGLPSTAYNGWTMTQYRGDRKIKTVIPAGFASSGPTSADPGGINIAASGGVAPLIVEGHAHTPTYSGYSFSPGADDMLTTGSTGLGAHRTPIKIYNSSPADHSLDIGDNGTGNFLCGYYLQCA